MTQPDSVADTAAIPGVSKIPESLLTTIIGCSVSAHSTGAEPDTRGSLAAEIVNAQQAHAEAFGVALSGLLTARQQQDRLRALDARLSSTTLDPDYPSD
ncbi:Uncharacterised protein [Mycobacteroides abscessus subsp. abscessus]|nr:Uncharacterised protein [Mycobacteroides abscessus subsp. abscessus]